MNTRAHARPATSPPGRPPRDWWITAGMTLTAVSAAASSFTGLRGLALLTGWPPALAPLLPATIDAYAITATRVWLTTTPGRSDHARRFARANAIGAISVSLAGNSAYHALVAHVMPLGWPVIVAVGAIPPTALGLLTHLAALRAQPQPAMDGATTPADPAAGVGRGRATPVRPRPSPDPDLLARARALDADHRARTQRPISRDTLRATLGIGSRTAASLIEAIRAQPDPRESDRSGPPDPDPPSRRAT